MATAYLSVNDGLPEPLCAIYEAKSQKRLLNFLKKGVTCPRRIMINSNVELLEPFDSKSLNNVNTPQEMEALARGSALVTHSTIHESPATSDDKNKTIHIQYYALLREERGLSQEAYSTNAKTVQELYLELQKKFKFKLTPDLLRVAINDEFAHWNTALKSDDHVVFIPPVSGG